MGRFDMLHTSSTQSSALLGLSLPPLAQPEKVPQATHIPSFSHIVKALFSRTSSFSEITPELPKLSIPLTTQQAKTKQH